ncbi:uncharacterized protein An13g03540 [Aspergillus niger]|uniref:Contig An13c0110, genomic contig n=2 Tax=Aspergillus niger TaxID=5061 RepID=A2R250_ASPNC|nr:uncharacterized protein An13g03540 [Aspergillus niger]CAK41750.1 unnamed protein product [Aspergillus niger]
MDAPSASNQHKSHSITERVKTTFKKWKRDKHTYFITLKSSISNVTADLDAKGDPASSKYDSSQTNDHNTKDFWQMAYEALTESDPNSIAVLFPLTGTKSQDTGNARTREKLDEVVEATKAQYKEKQRKDSIQTTANKILNSVLSFQDVIDNIVKFDPTGYASSAWAIVSLGLTMAKNHADLRGALFSSSEYLADLLTRCTFIEEQYYGDGDPNIVNAEKKQSIIRVYYKPTTHAAQNLDQEKEVPPAPVANSGPALTLEKENREYSESPRSIDRGSPKVHIPQMVPGIRKAIEDDPAIPRSSLQDQFNKLILQPLLTVDHSKVMKSIIIVINTLDKCKPEEDMEIILDLLPEVKTVINIIIRFFLISRPEIPIRCGFDEIDKSKYQNTILQDLDKDVIKYDIALYLREEFSKI